MEQATIEGAALAYDVAGSGEPVVCIHGAFIADTFRPLLAEPSLADRYRLIRYHRRGYAGSSRGRRARRRRPAGRRLPGAAAPPGRGAGACRGALLRRRRRPPAGAGRAGRRPLAGPAGAGADGGGECAGYREALARGAERYREAGAAVAVDEFLRGAVAGVPRRARAGAAGGLRAGGGRRGDLVRVRAARAAGLALRRGGGAAHQPAGARPCSAARATPSGPASARRTGCCWRGCRAPKGSSCPGRRT